MVISIIIIDHRTSDAEDVDDDDDGDDDNNDEESIGAEDNGHDDVQCGRMIIVE